MESYKAEGIVLRARDYGEADKILTIYTREWGRVQAIAKGVRKVKSKNKGAVQPFTHSKFLIYKGKSLDTVTQCQSINSFGAIRENLLKMAYASYIMELTDKLVIEKESNENIFILLLTTLFLMEEIDLPVTAGVYRIRLLTLLGYKPYLDGCVNCGSSNSNDTYRLSPLLGGLLCASCQKEDEQALKISKGSIAILRQFLIMDVRKLHLLKINTQMFKEINNIFKKYMQFYLDYPLKSEEFLEQIINDGITGGG